MLYSVGAAIVCLANDCRQDALGCPLKSEDKTSFSLLVFHYLGIVLENFMKIERRSSDIKDTRKIRDEKIRLVLDWLLEFRFSSIELLAKRLDSNYVNSYRFFARLIESEIIKEFKNAHTRHDRYVMLTAAGASYLESYGRNVERAETRVSRLGRRSNILHDLAVQEAVLNRIDQFEEVIWDKNISLGTDDNPDAILKAKKGYWVAIEYERWRKDKKRIYMSFINHSKSISKNKYAGVFYLFNETVDFDYYKTVFDEEKWPIYKRSSGKIKKDGNYYYPDKFNNLRKCFIFLNEPIKE